MRPLSVLALALIAACAKGAPAPRTLVLYEAASLSAPMRAILDTFSRRTGVSVEEEHGASLELARRITELQRVPDVIALADQEVFPELLVPAATTWYAIFARNRMVIAYTPRSRFAGEISAQNWHDVVRRSGVRFGRTDPVQAPAGYRALITFALAEQYYGLPGLARRLEGAAPSSLVRGNAADLAALLETGELDYIIEYESLARSHRFSFLVLPADIDLSDASRAAIYRRASVRVAHGRDTVTRTGAPIEYGVSVPSAAPHADTGREFVRFLLSAEGQEMLHRGFVDAIPSPEFRGKAPSSLRGSP